MTRMSYKTPGPVAGYFLVRLQELALPWRLYLTEQVFRMRVDLACEFLDIAQEAAGEAAAMTIAYALLDRFTADDATAAEIRLLRAEAQRFLLATQMPEGRPG